LDYSYPTTPHPYAVSAPSLPVPALCLLVFFDYLNCSWLHFHWQWWWIEEWCESGGLRGCDLYC